MRRACAFKSQNKVLYRLYTVFQWNGLANLTTTLRALYRRYEYALSKACNAHNRYRRNHDFGTILTYSVSYIHVHTNPTAQKNRENIEFISVFSTHKLLLVAGLERFHILRSFYITSDFYKSVLFQIYHYSSTGKAHHLRLLVHYRFVSFYYFFSPESTIPRI